MRFLYALCWFLLSVAVMTQCTWPCPDVQPMLCGTGWPSRYRTAVRFSASPPRYSSKLNGFPPASVPVPAATQVFSNTLKKMRHHNRQPFIRDCVTSLLCQRFKVTSSDVIPFDNYLTFNHHRLVLNYTPLRALCFAWLGWPSHGSCVSGDAGVETVLGSHQLSNCRMEEVELGAFSSSGRENGSVLV